MAEMMSAAQRGTIFALAKKAGMDNDALHDVVRLYTGRDSLKELTKTQAIWTIDALKRYTGQAEPLGMVSSAQRGKVYALCRELGWTTSSGAIDMTRLEGFVAARYKIESLVWVDSATCGRLIEALKAMAVGGRGERRRAAP